MSNSYKDKQIQEALENLDFPFQEQDWDLMNARLDEEKKRTGKFFWFRTIEAAFLLLAVWTVVEFVPFNQNSSTPISPEIKEQLIPQNEIKATPPPSDYLQKLNNATKSSPNIEDQPTTAQPNAQPTAAVNLPKTNINQTETSTNNKFISSTKVVSAAPSVVDFKPAYVNSIPNNQSSTRLMATPEMTISSPIPSELVTASTSKEVFKQDMFSSILGKSSTLNWNSNLDIDLDDLPAQYTPGDPLPKLKKFRPWNIKLYFSPEMNSKPNNSNLGLAAGGLITKEISQGLHLGGGLSYNSKQFAYAPNDLMPTSINQVQLMNIQQHHVEIPLELEYTIKESVNWRPYVVGGLSTNLVMYTKYDYELIGNVEKPSTLTHEYPSSENGLISGGSFKTNSYYTANVGIGLERQLDNNLHLFIQPTFKYALKGIGSRNEKINTVGLTMGARTTL